MRIFITKYFILTFSLSLCFYSVNCKKGPVAPQPGNPLQVTVEDVSCTEVWLRVSLASSEQARNVLLKRGDSTIFSISIIDRDILVLDTLLSPNTTYTYTLIKPTYGYTPELHASAQVTTMATTSQNWVWTVERIGVTATSLYDVAIVNDTLAFAVGEINDGDTGTGEKLYNAAKWNGSKWELMKLQLTTSVDPINSIFAVSDSNVWFDPWYQWNGKTFQKYSVNPSVFNVGTVRKMWGNANDLYVVGDNGFIARRNTNGKWQKIESGTTATLFDVWGGNPDRSGNKWLGDNVVLITSFIHNNFGHNKLFRITNGLTVDSIALPGEYQKYGLLTSVWFNQYSPLFICGDWIYTYNGLTGWNSEENKLPPPMLGTYRIRGNGANDILTGGTNGLIAHFNGITWKVFDEVKSDVRNFRSVAIRGNLAIAVGDEGNQFSVGIIALGIRK